MFQAGDILVVHCMHASQICDHKGEVGTVLEVLDHKEKLGIVIYWMLMLCGKKHLYHDMCVKKESNGTTV